MFLLFLVPTVFFGIRDLRPAIREGKWFYAFAYLAMVTTALVLWLLLYRGVPVTSPNTWVKQLIDMLAGAQ